MIYKHFLPFSELPFQPSNTVFQTKILGLIYQFSSFMYCAFGITSKITLPNARLQTPFPRSFKLSIFKFRSLIILSYFLRQIGVSNFSHGHPVVPIPLTETRTF